MPSPPPPVSQPQMPPSESPASLSKTMGFSTFGSKPHLAKKRKLDGPPNAKRTGSNSLPIGSKRGGEMEIDVNVGIHLNEDDGDGDGEIMGTGGEDTIGVEDRSFGDEELRKEEGNENFIMGTAWSAQTSSLGSGRSMRLSERETLPMAPAIFAPTSTAVHDTADSSRTTTPALTTTAGSGSGYSYAALRHGVRDQNGDMAYYDHSFVEDPWKGLR